MLKASLGDKLAKETELLIAENARLKEGEMTVVVMSEH